MNSHAMKASVSLLGQDHDETSVDTTAKQGRRKAVFGIGMVVMVVCLVAAVGSRNARGDVISPSMAFAKGEDDNNPNSTSAFAASNQATVGLNGYVWLPHTGNGCGSTCSRYDSSYNAVTSGVYGYGGYRFYVCAVSALASGYNSVVTGVNYCVYRDSDAVQTARIGVGSFQCLCREPTRKAEMWVSNRAKDGSCAQVCSMQGTTPVSAMFGDQMNICMSCLNYNDCRSGNNGHAQTAKKPCSIYGFVLPFSSMACLCA